LDPSITNTAVMIGRYEHIQFLAVSRSESDEADRPRRRMSASVFFVLSALTALLLGHYCSGFGLTGHVVLEVGPLQVHRILIGATSSLIGSSYHLSQ